jgi:ADP-ribose pyrophosphatase YjhB (NUDIX family)
LPYRFTKSGAPEILLVTTRQTKRWIIPKGWPIKGLKPAKSAAREAYEEAGVRGSVKTKAIGIFSYEKRSEEDSITIPCDVRVFPLLVKRQSKTWPESEQRVAQWLEPAVALPLVEEGSLRSLISSFMERIETNPVDCDAMKKRPPMPSRDSKAQKKKGLLSPFFVLFRYPANDAAALTSTT